jgi:hypothetical protein
MYIRYYIQFHNILISSIIIIIIIIIIMYYVIHNCYVQRVNLQKLGQYVYYLQNTFEKLVYVQYYVSEK